MPSFASRRKPHRHFGPGESARNSPDSSGDPFVQVDGKRDTPADVAIRFFLDDGRQAWSAPKRAGDPKFRYLLFAFFSFFAARFSSRVFWGFFFSDFF